ncbi:Lipid A biosynthesis acyltransferase [Tenacibaculum maritimum]|uniref:lysophospholipid acyltransferase family protein n=1 Tax=Tenacibaculum maritimum TaxID=107401 RepID=UPI0012E46E76|nr:lysophospholipid acyltransferase family protein [Tenacibaculum maritimum]CAA0164396.1 Lipid A biosynthesis acyltransferase [Tenacibaculum maritimum]
MSFLIFALTYPFIWLLSKLPMWFLYLISDFFFFLIHYVFGYRKKVVESNLRMAFPQKSNAEIKSLSKKFSRHFTDLIMESVKAFSMSEKSMRKRYVYKNISLINELAQKGKSIVLTGSHQANWEWSFGLPMFAKLNCYGTYTKIQNPYFEKVIKSSRKKFGYDGTVTTLFNKSVNDRVKKNIQSLYILLSDQSPQVEKTKYWANFFNIKVPVHTGAEILAKKHNFVVVNMNITKKKRGYYEAEFQLITETPNKLKDFEITDRYLQITTQHITKQPEFYLWSHKRFKHKDRYDEWHKKQTLKSSHIPQSV